MAAPQPRRATMGEIAAGARVSIGTVSAILHGGSARLLWSDAAPATRTLSSFPTADTDGPREARRLALITGRTGGTAQEEPVATIALENRNLRLEFDTVSGSLVSLTAVRTGWRILDRPRLGLAFELLVPTRGDADWRSPGRRNNPVRGADQRLAELDRDRAGRSMTFTWDGLVDASGGRHDIRLSVAVTLDDETAVWTAEVENRSPFVVENVQLPCLGDVRRPGGSRFEVLAPDYSDPVRRSLWPTFTNTHGYFGTDVPGFHLRTPHQPFCLLLGETEGLFVGQSGTIDEPVVWSAELHPGYECSMTSRVPAGETIGGHDVATRFSVVHLPYVGPGESRRLAPIAMAAFSGGWQAGADVHRRLRGSARAVTAPRWAAEPGAWLQLHINSPEDELRLPFRDLVRVGEECVRHGVKAIQLVGWNDGGQDQGNPSHDCDPRLGTPEELKAAIAAIEEMGVRVVLFAKFTWADRATGVFRESLHRLAAKDPYGDYCVYPGYRYQTQTQLADVNTKRLVPMCFLSEEYLSLCVQEFRKTVELGASGILFDESQHHGTAYLCFDTAHGHRRGAWVYANDCRLIREFRRVADPEFLFAGEACYDAEFAEYQLSYHRSFAPDHVPVQRYLLPEAQIMTAVTGFDDRNMINQCLLCRYVISYEPFNFKGRLDDFPQTVAYGRHMDELRTELRDFLWDGEFRHELGATVREAGGAAAERPVSSGSEPLPGAPRPAWAVFRRRSDNRAALAVANYAPDKHITAAVSLDDGAPLERWRMVGTDEWRAFRGTVDLPARSAVVIV